MSPSSKRGRRPDRPTRPVPTTPVDETVEMGRSATPASSATPPAGPAGFDPDEIRAGRYGRLGAAAGVAYAVVGFIGWSLLPIGQVEPEDPADAIAREIVAARGRISAGILLTLFSLFFLMVFVAWLHRWLRKVEGEDGWLATLALVGGVLMIAMLSVVVLLSIASTVLEDYGGDPVMARTLLVLQWQAVAVAFVPTAGFVGGISLIARSSGVLPRWVAVTGLVIAAGLLIPPLAFLPFLISSLWTGMLAVVLLQRHRFG